MATAFAPLQAPLYVEALNREALIEEHLSLVKYLASRFGSKLPPNVDVDDLVGAGTIGLIDAADKFNPDRNIRFRTYAERRIRGAILDHLRSLDWAPRSLRRRAREVESAQAKLQQSCGRPVDAAELAGFLQIDVAELQSLVNEINTMQVTSLHTYAENDSEGASGPIETLAAAADESPLSEYERVEKRDRLAAAIEALPEKERLVVSLYYVEELTMKEIGAVIGVNESRVSQIHSKAISRLRMALVCLAA
jgi:RNA polymerase sigma factor for flagellar operon FliA